MLSSSFFWGGGGGGGGGGGEGRAKLVDFGGLNKIVIY